MIIFIYQIVEILVDVYFEKNFLIQGRNENFCKNCYFFQNDLNITDNIYDISKLYFLKN